MKKITKLEFDEDYNLNKIIDELIKYKIEFGIEAYTIFQGEKLSNEDIVILINLRDSNDLSTDDKVNFENSLYRALKLKQVCKPQLKYWINRAKKCIPFEVEELFEYECYHLLDTYRHPDGRLLLEDTIIAICYILVSLIENDNNLQIVMDGLMFNTDKYIDERLLKIMIKKYSNQVGFVENILFEELPTIDSEEEIVKIKKITKRYKNFNDIETH